MWKKTSPKLVHKRSWCYVYLNFKIAPFKGDESFIWISCPPENKKSLVHSSRFWTIHYQTFYITSNLHKAWYKVRNTNKRVHLIESKNFEKCNAKALKSKSFPFPVFDFVSSLTLKANSNIFKKIFENVWICSHWTW